MEEITIRPARHGEASLVRAFILRLAEYEALLDLVDCDEERLEHELFHRRSIEAVFACEGDEPVGMALFFHNFSTFLGRRGLFLEDLFVLPEKRGHGVGTALLRHLAALAVERGCQRMEWACLDWNAPSIAFYRSLGAKPLDDWTTYRLEGDALQALAEP